MRTFALTLLLVGTGCFLSRQTDGDGDERDGGATDFAVGPDGIPAVDGPSAGCEPLGGYVRCGPTCPDHECETFPPCTPDLQICPPRSQPLEGYDEGSNTCGIAEPESARAKYCWKGDFCAERGSLGGESFGGVCVREEWCREAAELGLESRCRYSDGTYYEDGPPYPETCPAGADPRLPFCGGPCGPCPALIVGAPNLDNVDCVGMNEERGWGICAFRGDQTCERDRRVGQLAIYSEELGAPFSCLVPFDETSDDGLARRGWIVLLETCEAYREAFGDDFTCVDDDWNED